MDIKTAEEIKADILGGISDDYAKTEGNITHDIPASVSIVLEGLYGLVGTLYNKIDVDQLTGDELTRFVKQRKGTIRKLKTYAIGEITATGNGTIDAGDLFETETGIQFEATETKVISGSGAVKVRCLSGGTVGVVGANTIKFIPVTIAGITTVTNAQPTYDGFDDETDDSLRTRYYEALQIPPTSGNIYHYLKWAKEVNGVGGAKVFPLWEGDNTVKVVIINADMIPASSEIVEAVQAYIDPEISGKGEGQAPIGAYCTVTSAAALFINIECDVEPVEGYTIEEVTQNISVKIVDYLKSIAFKQNYVSYAKIGSLIFETEGVKDYTALLVNLGNVNIDIDDQEVAVIGTITIS